MTNYTYKSGDFVQLGDRVMLRSFFIFRDYGQVVYVPGASDPHPDMIDGPIEHVGVKLDGGDTAAVTIDPESNTVIGLRFIGRGRFDANAALDPSTPIFDEE
ncbi:hypothetical protein [Luteolibacter marinus]|uniref:hypothetical protein n=1 Tax=Luteolibacter marinus TaxID=2776705 RepID=UPI0018693AD8|nr:hypothetical protein [Luteolibacter marinus]